MNTSDFIKWTDDVSAHLRMVDSMVKDRLSLKHRMEEHLSQFFEWDEISYDKNFHKISLKWENSNPVIKHELIGDLGMDWVISASPDGYGGRCVVVELYPFGVDDNVKDDGS